MEALIACAVGLVAGGFVGYNFGVKRVLNTVREAFDDVMHEIRMHYGKEVQTVVDEQEVTLVQLDPYLEAQITALFETQ